MSGELHAPASLSSMRDSCFSFVGGALEHLDALLMPGFQPQFIGCLARGLVTVSTELSRLVLDVWGV